MSNKHDDIFASPLKALSEFRFDDKVATVFPDMIKRSVPGYDSIIAMTGTLAERYVQANSNCYDLGSSLGASTLAMRHHIKELGCKIIAVDNSSAMINRCRTILEASLLESQSSYVPVEQICGNIQDVSSLMP
jgi:tRNA (cmo5U34)-methyltransferase